MENNTRTSSIYLPQWNEQEQKEIAYLTWMYAIGEISTEKLHENGVDLFSDIEFNVQAKIDELAKMEAAGAITTEAAKQHTEMLLNHHHTLGHSEYVIPRFLMENVEEYPLPIYNTIKPETWPLAMLRHKTIEVIHGARARLMMKYDARAAVFSDMAPEHQEEECVIRDGLSEDDPSHVEALEAYKVIGIARNALATNDFSDLSLLSKLKDNAVTVVDQVSDMILALQDGGSGYASICNENPFNRPAPDLDKETLYMCHRLPVEPMVNLIRGYRRMDPKVADPSIGYFSVTITRRNPQVLKREKYIHTAMILFCAMIAKAAGLKGANVDFDIIDIGYADVESAKQVKMPGSAVSADFSKLPNIYEVTPEQLVEYLTTCTGPIRLGTMF